MKSTRPNCRPPVVPFRTPRFLAKLVGLLVIGTLAASAFASRTDDLVRIHVEAIGGKERIAALKAMRADGVVVSGGKQMHFTMIAARPNRVRVETENAGRTLVQVSDGTNQPWEFDTGDWPPRYRDMPVAAAKTFAADAEFDDPLVGGAARGFTFDDAGEVESDGRKLIRILVTQRLTQTFSLLLDPETYLITRRIEQRKNPFGGSTQVVTVFADYRPVQGVLVPHKVALVIDGQVKQQTQIDSIQPNPTLSEDTFERPRSVGVKQKE